MAHVHGAKAVADAGVKIIGSAVEKMGETMARPVVSGAVAGAVATARTSTVKKIITHPLALLGVGFALGYVAYKYRQALLQSQETDQ